MVPLVAEQLYVEIYLQCLYMYMPLGTLYLAINYLYMRNDSIDIFSEMYRFISYPDCTTKAHRKGSIEQEAAIYLY